MAKKDKPEIKLGATVRLKTQSGEIIKGRVVHLWEKSVPMVRVRAEIQKSLYCVRRSTSMNSVRG